MAGDWYLKTSGKELGPLSAQQLKAMADRGEISAGDPIRKGGQGNWVPASQVKGLLTTELSSKTTGPPPSPTSEPPADPARTSQTVPVAKPVEDPGQTSGTAIPVAKPVEAAAPPITTTDFPTTPVVAPPAATPSDGPPGKFHIQVDDDGPQATRSAKKTPEPASPKKRQRNNAVVVVACVLSLLAIGVAGLGVMLSKKNTSPKPKAPRATANNAAPDSRQQGDISIAGLDEYLGTGSSEDGQKAQPGAAESPDESGSTAEWIDASQSSAERGDVAVKIVSAEIGRPTLVRLSTGAGARPKYQCLTLKFELYNKNPSKKLQYQSWNNRPIGVSLVDNHQNSYSIKSFRNLGVEIDGQVQGGQGSLYPEEPTTDVLVFEKPIKDVDYLRLELPAAAFGQKGPLKFQIPNSMIVSAEEFEDEIGLAGAEPEASRGHPDDEISPGRAVPAIARGIAELDAEGAAMQGEQEPDDGGPIAVPGITGEESDKKVSLFSDDPEVGEASEDFRRKQSEDRNRRGRNNKR